MKKVLALAVLALLVVPAAALAGGPGTHGKSAPKVQYILRGTLSAYVPYNDPTNGSITITVGHSNYHGRALKGQTLTFPLVAKSRIVLRHKLTTITDNDLGVVKVRALKRIDPADLATTLQAVPARQVIDRGVPRH
jgi:hypothetical protein